MQTHQISLDKKKIILDINTDMYHLEPRVLCQQQKDTTDFDVK